MKKVNLVIDSKNVALLQSVVEDSIQLQKSSISHLKETAKNNPKTRELKTGLQESIKFMNNRLNELKELKKNLKGK